MGGAIYSAQSASTAHKSGLVLAKLLSIYKKRILLKYACEALSEK